MPDPPPIAKSSNKESSDLKQNNDKYLQQILVFKVINRLNVTPPLVQVLCPRLGSCKVLLQLVPLLQKSLEIPREVSQSKGECAQWADVTLYKKS